GDSSGHVGRTPADEKHIFPIRPDESTHLVSSNPGSLLDSSPCHQCCRRKLRGNIRSLAARIYFGAPAFASKTAKNTAPDYPLSQRFLSCREPSIRHKRLGRSPDGGAHRRRQAANRKDSHGFCRSSRRYGSDFMDSLSIHPSVSANRDCPPQKFSLASPIISELGASSPRRKFRII